jgi:signal transduction histidine kinase
MEAVEMLRVFRSLLPAVMILAGISPATAAAAPGGVQRVLILDSYGRDFAPYSSIASTFRTELAQRSANPIEFLEMSLETARFEEPEETAAVEYVRVLCERRKFDLVVPNGQPAARFWVRHREGLLPGAPTLFAAVDERHLSQLPLSPDEAVVATRLDLPGLLRHILQILPGTTNVVVVIGNSPLEQFWLSELRREWSPFHDRVRITFLNELPFEEMLRRTAALPPHSAIFVALILVDAAGVPHELAGAVDRLRASANAPLFGWSDDLLGHGIVGGPLLPLESVGRDAALAAQRILAGERPGAVRSPVTGASRRVYDWRELRRWNIESRRLPPGSEILFRPPSLISEYRWTILASLGIIAAQALAITGLLVLRRRRRQAVGEAQRLGRELAHAGRVSVMGQLASSLAHELNQPLGAILRNAEAAELFLNASPPNLDEVRAILADIRSDDHRAGSVIEGIRALLRRHDMVMNPVSLGAILDAVAALIRPDAQSRGVALAIEADRDLPPVLGNPAQLQQVLLNLMINGMEAMDGTPGEGRTLTVRARPGGADWVEIAVGDSGPGIPPEELPRIFDNFYTTKPGGMGMGLAICRRIVEAHGGQIRAENGAGGGATFRLTLPVAGGVS